MNGHDISIYSADDVKNKDLIQLLLYLIMKDDFATKDVFSPQSTHTIHDYLAHRRTEPLETLVDPAQRAIDLAQRNALAAKVLQKTLGKIIH